MAVQVKICGVRDAGCARACVDAGIDLVGFNFVPTSKRHVSPDNAAAWVALVGSQRAVGVFRNQPVQEMQQVARRAGVQWIQLHGDEPALTCAMFRENGFRVIKALAVTEALTREVIAGYHGAVDLLLFDAARPGSGALFEHDRLLALAPPRPFWLAGGLAPDNVAAAVRRVRPDGVDTASGVEQSGRMSNAKIVAFYEQARGTRPA
ncbi:MAG: phosphoribosylanthranilate isomerase [Polyangiaceae bacterium]|jgi:phosphoribosylanthranilate isomerase|nr:phosphoribosylanthranilate isomerase [Polyangiaceae bacterium]